MRELHSTAWKHMSNALFGTFKTTEDFWRDISTVQGSLGNRTTDYWFGLHSANKSFPVLWREQLLVASEPILIDDDKKLYVAQSKKFLKDCEKLQGMLRTVLQDCSASPARVTELSVWQIRNTSLASRHMFISHGQLFTVGSYHKSRLLQEGRSKPKARFPDLTTTKLLLLYLLLIRPVEDALSFEINTERKEIILCHATPFHISWWANFF